MKRIIAIMLCALMLFSFAACSKENGGTNNGTGSTANTPVATGSELGGSAELEKAIAENELTLVNVWATWCTPCVNELPELQKIADKYDNVAVVGILADGVNSETLEKDETAVEAAIELMNEKGVSYTVVIPDKDMFEKYVVNAMYLPTSYFVDSQGNIVGTEIIGANTESSWSQYIDQTLANLAAAAPEAE